MIYTIRDLVGDATCQSSDAYGRWSRAIPLPFYSGSFGAAWAVLTGKAVAVRYPVSGELEQALQKSGGLHVAAVESSVKSLAAVAKGPPYCGW